MHERDREFLANHMPSSAEIAELREVILQHYQGGDLTRIVIASKWVRLATSEGDGGYVETIDAFARVLAPIVEAQPEPLGPPERECYRCGRRGIRQFLQVKEGWKCASWASCRDRVRKVGERHA
jgi:hypothetical protein